MTEYADTPAVAPRPPSSRAGAIIVLVCLALGAVSAQELHFMSRAHGTPLSWTTLLLSTMPRWLVLAAALPWVFHVTIRASGLTRRQRIAVHVVTFMVVSLLHA